MMVIIVEDIDKIVKNIIIKQVNAFDFAYD